MAKPARRGSKQSDSKTKRVRAGRTPKRRAAPTVKSPSAPARTPTVGRESKKPRSTKSSVKRYLAGEEGALREAVRSECLKQFERRLGRPWDPELERVVRSDAARRADQQEAFEVHERLRTAIAKAVEFVNRPRAYAPPLGLGSWVSRFITPLSEHDFLRKREPPAPAEVKPAFSSERHRLVAKCDAADFIGARRRLDATELAIVWLLGGGSPDPLPPSSSGVTPSQVIQAEARKFRAAARELGKKPARPSYRARFQQDETGRWSASVHIDAERTCVAEGNTLDEAHQRLREALAMLVDDEE